MYPHTVMILALCGGLCVRACVHEKGVWSLTAIPSYRLLKLCMFMSAHTDINTPKVHAACCVHTNRPVGWKLQPPNQSVAEYKACMRMSEESNYTCIWLDSDIEWHSWIQLQIGSFCIGLSWFVYIDMLCWQWSLAGFYARAHHNLQDDYVACLN